MDRNYRIHTNIATDTILNVNMQQDYDFLEVLTMKLRQKDAYRLHSSNYGVIIGRVLANDAFGIPNAKISVFIERDTNDSVDMENIYPYSEVTSRDKEGRRYNLLPDYSDDDCYRIVGTFPNKRLLLDNDIQLEIYDKYWKYTTVTNNAGDYMIFGVPSGNQQIHVDIDLSDIGILSQKPRDFEYKGYNVTMFDNPSQFKESTNLESLAQLFSQDKSVFVYPFWGDADNGIAAITRADIQIQYKFEPTCVFMGSIVSDNEGNSIGHRCAASVDNGMNDQLVAGEGTIEMIRKTQDGLVEEFQIQGNQLIDSNGVWCYQIPMNLDFIGTDEYGNIVPTDNPTKGIPTRTQVRFRISKHDTGDEGFSTHTAKYLVPMNPIFSEKKTVESVEGEGGVMDCVIPVIDGNGQDIENMYTFGSNTPQSCFRDLYWNNVYSVKNYIPKVQMAHRPYSQNYSALKGSNLSEDKNPIPFNKLRVDLPFMYVIICIITDIISFVVGFINRFIICGINSLIKIVNGLADKGCILGWCPFDFLKMDYLACIRLGTGLSDTEIFAPDCKCSTGQEAIENDSEINPDGLKVNSSKDALKNLVLEKLAEDFKIIKLDLYQDWVNGCLYMPLWYWRKRKKKTYLFGLITRRAKNQFCDCNTYYQRLKTYVTCNIPYNGNSLEVNDDKQVPDNVTTWHRKRAKRIFYGNGVIKGVENKDGLTAYYYSALSATGRNLNEKLLMGERENPFYAFRLYATDIILLGNLNEDNLYGLPQFFKVLPSTTANIPPIATIQEVIQKTKEEEEQEAEEERRKEEERMNLPEESRTYDTEASEDSGTTVTTGMNWRIDGRDDTPKYANGLFMELGCTEVVTKPKSCFNVERLSELGVNLDMSYNMSYSYGNNITYGEILPDGFISKLELDDMENRAMFATMNHIGFVPQEYQDSISAYTTQVEDENTRYLVPKFRYIYPVDFDGRQQLLMTRYKKNFKQHMFDETDESYLTFRFGADKKPDEKGEKNRMRHFYYHDDGQYEMPVYNNSFFFYFGIKKGSTAIDKFNNLFYSQCFRNSKKPFSYTIDSKGKAYCPSIYNEVSKNKPYGYIRFNSDDIQIPYSYTLSDSQGNVIIHEDYMTEEEFVIGGKIVNNKEVSNNFGAITYQNNPTSAICSGASGGYVDCPYNPQTYNERYMTLKNESYILDITDVNGKTLSEEITLTAPALSFNYASRGLGVKFKDTDTTTMDYVCNRDNGFYGLIIVDKVYIDGQEFTIIDAKVTSRDTDVYTVSATTSGTSLSSYPLFSGKTASVIFELTNSEDNVHVSDCFCNGQGTNIGDFSFHDNQFEFTVYQPMTYIMSMYLMCDDKPVIESTVVNNIAVNNGEDFDAFLNDMPLRFMMGSVTNPQIAVTNSKFYKAQATENPKGNDVIGWYGLHNEKTYLFPQTIEANNEVWPNYASVNGATSLEERKNILRYKFDRMFELCNVGYMTSESSNEFYFYARGGVPPTLTRVLSPYYDDENYKKQWLYADRSFATNNARLPNIVGTNYWWDRSIDRTTSEGSHSTSSPDFNGAFLGNGSSGRYNATKYSGNYFAAFTNNGKYFNSISGDCKNTSIQVPSNAAINLDARWKPLSEDMIYTYNNTTFCSTNNGVLKRAAHTSSDGKCSYNTYPHFRAMFIDKKFDYDLVVCTPILSKINLYHSNQASWNEFLNNARISGYTYNALEMSYDNDSDHNIISANTNEEGIATANNRLEYSYSANIAATDDAKTIYNAPTTNCLWRGEAKDSDPQAIKNLYTDDGTKQLLKSLYSAMINYTVDVRNFFWSTFNQTNLTTYWNAKDNGRANNQNHNCWLFDNLDDIYLFKHTDNTLYNGDFSENNYPTKRLIDIGNINGETDFRMTLTCCSYKMATSLKEKKITCKTSKGEKLDFNLNYDSPIRITRPQRADDDYANIEFVRRGTRNGFIIFGTSQNNTKNGTLIFKFNQHSIKGFKGYPRTLRLVRVLDDKRFNENGEYKTDGITYIKTASKEDNLFNYGPEWDTSNPKFIKSYKTIEGRINIAAKETFEFKASGIVAMLGVYVTGRNVYVDDIDQYDKVGPKDWYYHYSERRMATTDSHFDLLTFVAPLDHLNDGNSDGALKAVAVAAPIDYYYGSDSNHEVHVQAIEFSEVFDLRNIELKLNDGSSTTAFTFVINRNNGETTSIRMLNQTVNEDCSYGFVFLNGDDRYAANVQPTFDETYITLNLTFDDGVTISTDRDWPVKFFIMTISGFTYRIDFTLRYDSDNSKWTIVT